MKHLFDTCTLLNKLSKPSYLIEVMKKVDDKKDNFLIPDIVIDELAITQSLTEEQIEQSNGIINTIDLGCKNYSSIDIVRVNSNDVYKRNFDEIRFRYYSHVSQKELLRRVKEKEITKKEANHLKKKDYGECACIAIAMTKANEFIIISEDDGKIVEFPEKNIFEIYRNSHNIRVYKFNKWKDMMELVS